MTSIPISLTSYLFIYAQSLYIFGINFYYLDSTYYFSALFRKIMRFILSYASKLEILHILNIEKL